MALVQVLPTEESRHSGSLGHLLGKNGLSITCERSLIPQAEVIIVTLCECCYPVNGVNLESIIREAKVPIIFVRVLQNSMTPTLSLAGNLGHPEASPEAANRVIEILTKNATR